MATKYKSLGELNREKKTPTSTTSVSSKVSSKINPAYSSKEIGKEIKSGNSLATGTSKKRDSSSKKSDDSQYWMENALDLYKEGQKKKDYDSTFSKDFFRNTPEMDELLNVSLEDATPMQAIMVANTFRQIQAGNNYRTKTGEGADYTPGESQYGLNDSVNQNYNNWINKFKATATENDVSEALKYLEKIINEAGNYDSDYKTRTLQDIADLKKWAGNTYSSFATMELNDYDTKIARNNIRIRELGAYNNGLSEADATAAQAALGILLSGSGDPIATVQNNKDLRRITDYDNLAKQYSDPYELGDAIIDSLMDFNDRAGSTANGQESYDEYVRLVEENDTLKSARAEVEERRNSLLEREKYAAMPGTSTSNTSLSHFHPEPYEVATQYSRRNMETGQNETFYEYNTPTLAQMVADPEGVWDKYQQASAHSSVTGSANEIDLVRRMTEEERNNYKKVYAAYGEEEANKYFDIILRDELNVRQTQQLAEEYAAAAEEHPVAAYLGSVGTNFLSRINDAANTARGVLGMELGQNQWGEITNAQLNTVYQKAADATPWANFDFFGETANPFVWLLQGAQAAGQEALDTAVFGPLKNLWMGITAGSAGFVDNYEKYGDRGNAILSGLGTAAAEFGSEWLGDKFGDNKVFSKLNDLDTGWKKAGYLAKGAISEGIEEGLSNIGSAALDAAAGEFTGVGSKIADRIRYLMANGYTQTEAWSVLAKEYTPEVLQDAIIGAIAGFGMSGSNVAATTAYDNSVNRKAGSMIQKQGNVSAVLSMGLQSDDPGVKRVSEMLMKKLNLTDPNQDVLPNDPETKAELDLVQEAVAESGSGKQLDQEKQEKHQMRDKELKEAADQKKQNLAEKRATPEETKEKIENLSLTRRQKKQVGQVYRKVLNALDVDVEARRKDLRTGIEQKRAELAQDVKEHLRKIGERPIDEVVEAIAAVALDDPNLTIDQLDIAEAYAARKGVVKDLWDVYARTVEQRDTYAAATSRKLDASKQRTADMVSEMKARTGEQTITAAGDISYTTDEGDTITGKLESFAAAENGDVAAVVDGKIVPVDRLEIGDEGRDKLFRYAAELRNPDAANAMYEGIEENQDVDAYASGFEAAYHYGEIGIDITKAKQRATVDMLTPKQFESAYVAGASAAAARPKTVASKVAGKISFADGLDKRLDGLDANQKGAISVMRRFAEVGSVNIEFFESQANDEGSYTEYENGSYNPETNTIRIDINAGKNKVSDVANYAMLRVASHELTHYIKAQNTEAYQKLQDFVVEHLSAEKNTTFDALVELKMQQQPKLSYEAAVEEVVADGSEMMLKNSTVIQQLALKDKSLFQRIRDWLRDFAKNVQAAFRGVSARSAEARLLQNVKGMQKLWDNALLGAIENVRSAQVSGTTNDTIQTDNQKFSVRSNVEYTKDLIAVHNLNASKLDRALNLGGFPMPSIAIAKDSIGHQNFGDISLVFGRETIDPKENRKNKVYSADAWTPTFPRIEYEADPKVEKRIRTTLTKLGNSMENYLNDRLRQIVYGIDEYLNRFEGEKGFIEYAMNNYGLKAAFLEDQGQHVDVVKTEKRVGKVYSDDLAASYQKVIDLFGGDMYDALSMPLSQIRDAYGSELEQIRPGSTKSAMRLSAMIRNAAEYQQTANQPAQYESVEDYGATERSIDEKIDKPAFEAWVKNLFGGIEGSSGVYNNKPIFTDSGNRRSFSSTHMPVTVENIAKAMASQGNTKNVSGFHGIKSVRAATARTLKNVDEMHAYEGRIQNRTEEEAEMLNRALDNQLYDLIHEVLQAKYPNGNTGLDYTYAEDVLGEVFLEIAEGKYSVSSIQKTLATYNYNVSTETAEAIKQLFDDTAAMPVNMYEAKPERAVGFEEVKFAVVPDDLDTAVKARLGRVVPDIREYPAGDEAARLEALNSRSDVKFSHRTSDDSIYTMTRTQYNRFGWATRNDILSPEEVDEIEHRNRKDFNGKNPGVKTKDGMWALPIGEEHGIDNVIAVTDMKFGNPKIARVYRIDSDNENYNEKVRDKIYEAERTYGRDAWAVYESLFEAELVSFYRQEDYIHLYEDRKYLAGKGSRSREVAAQTGEMQQRSGREEGTEYDGPVNQKYSIRESSDGYKYVDVDTDQAQFDGLSSSEKRKLAEKIIRSKFVGKVIGTDYKVYVNGTGANEYAYPAKFIQDPAIIDAKMRAAPELENLIDAGFNFRTEKDGEYGHTHTNAVDGFTHFDTVFHVAGEYYIGRINVINGKRGKLFKDLTQIKSIVPDHVGSSGQIALANIVNNASNPTVPQVGGSVKSSLRTFEPSERELLLDVADKYATNDTQREFLARYRKKMDELSTKRNDLREIRSDIWHRQEAMRKKPESIMQSDRDELARQKKRASLLASQISTLDGEIVKIIESQPVKTVLRDVMEEVNRQDSKKKKDVLAEARRGREITEIRRGIKRIVDDFNRRLIKPTEKNYIPKNMVKLVIKAQEIVNTNFYEGKDLTYSTQRTIDNAKHAAAKMAEMKALYDRYRNDATFAYVHDNTVSEAMQKIVDKAEDISNSLYMPSGKTIYSKDVEYDILSDVYFMMKMLRKQVTEAVKLKAGEYAANIFEAGREMYRETQEAAPVANGKKGDFINWQLTPDKFFARLAGYKKGSMWSGVAKSFSDGTEKMLEIQREAYYHFRKWTESKEFDKLNDTGDKNLIDIGLKDESGKAVKVTRGMMLEVYMHLSSEDNMRGFMYGGFSVPNLKKYYAGKVAESYGTGSVNTVGTSMELAELAEQLRDPDLTEAQQAEIQRQMDEVEQRGMDRINAMRATIESKLTAWDRGLIEAVHRWNDGNSRDHINDVTMDLYGIKRAQVDNYYPIHRDKAFVNTDFESISRNVNLENWGSLKDRVPSRAPILLGDIAFTLDTSINQMSRYVGYARAQRDFNKLYNVRMPGMAGSVKKIVGTKFGTGDRVIGVSGEKYLENYIGSITGSRHAESDFLSVIRRNLPRATMTLNARVAFSQLSAIPKAAAEVGWDSVASGLARGGARAIFSKKAREELAQQNAWFWQRYRGEGGQREFADIKGGSGIIDKAWNKMDDLTKGWLLNWCQDFDIMSTVSMWNMAKEWTRKHTSFKEGTEEFTEAANRKYTDILRNTQAANTVSERSDLARDTRPLSILTMYKSEAFANFNMIYDAAARLRKYSQDAKTGKNSVTQADVKKARNQLINSSISVVVGASLTNAILKLAVNALTSSMNNYRDEDDEITLKSTLTAILNEVLGDIASMVVIGGELYDRFIGSKIFGDAYFAPNDAALSEILDALKYTNEVFERDASVEERMASAQKLFIKVCNMLGIPYNNVKRQAKGLMDTIADITAGEAFSFEASADRSNGTNYRRMLKASIEGDDTKYANVLAELQENGVELAEAQEGYRDKLKEAFEDGEIDRDRAIELLTNYGGKNADDAYWMVDKWEYTGEDSYSKYADLKSALAAGDSSKAAAEVEELLNHGVKEETLASQISTLYGKGEATSILALQLRPGRLYTPSVKEGQEDKKDDFNAFLDAVLAGKGVEEEISKLRSKGYSTNKMMSALSGAFGKSANRYAIMVKYNPAEAKILEERILDAYVALGLNREQERTWIHENWTMPEEE